MRRHLVVTMTTVIAMCSLVSAAEAAQPKILSPAKPQFGQTYKQWSATWIRWAFGMSVHSPPFTGRVTHPLVDLTGSACGAGQSGPVWYLGGAFFQVGVPNDAPIVRNRCSVPRGKALFFPMLNATCTAVEGTGNGCGASLAERQAIVGGLIDLVDPVQVDVDGRSLQIPKGARVGAGGPGYCLTMAPDDLLTWIGETNIVPGITCDTADDGYYAMLEPLPAGRHVVHFRGEVPSFQFVLDVTYRLRVV
jgi:hypothetical protein